MLKKNEYRELRKMFVKCFGENGFYERDIKEIKSIFKRDKKIVGSKCYEINKLYKEFLYGEVEGFKRKYDLDEYDRFGKMIRRLRNMD